MQTHNRHWQVSISSHKRWWHTGTQAAEHQVLFDDSEITAN